MSARVLDGVLLADRIKAEVRAELAKLPKAGRPHLVALHAGDDPGSRMYLRSKAAACEGVGIRFSEVGLDAETPQARFLAELVRLGDDTSVSGIIVQMPLPPGIDARAVQRAIPPHKDVEGVSAANMGMLVSGRPFVSPCTAQAAVALIEESGAEIAGAEAVVVGHSEIVGKPVALLLLRSADASATVTVCHIATRGLADHTRRADILIVAAGVPGLLRGDMIKPGAVVIDVGINRVPVTDKNGEPALAKNGRPRMRTVGDVVLEEAARVAGAITPVPGGVGPVTVAMLLRNTAACARASSASQARSDNS